MSRPLSVAVLLLAVCVPPAAADGLPLPVDASIGGVLSTDGRTRYVTAELDRRTVLIAQQHEPDTGIVKGVRLLRGRWTTPLVSYDGTADGLSKNGRTLVLIQPRPRAKFPRATTPFAVIATDPRHPGRLKLSDVVRLRGDFSFDALSPDGRSLFLIQYVSKRDPANYRVRVLDLDDGRLDPKPISDPHRLQTDMQGYPFARATSPSGRWVYTLYDGGHHPFVHALDTRKRWAMCIDLDISVHAVRSGRFRLSFDALARKLNVVRISGPTVRTIDPQTFEVQEPAASATPPNGEPHASRMPWPALAGLPVLFAAGGLAARRRRRVTGRAP